MLNKKQQLDKVHTVIGAGTKLEGKLISQGTVRIDGQLTGEIQSEANVIIGKEGSVQGNISAHSITVEGTVLGNIVASEHIQLLKGCKLEGDLEAKALEIEKEAHFNGRSTMRSPGNEKENRKKGQAADVSATAE
jgi:cytoskeletal protein CcmA (bactofilin family)